MLTKEVEETKKQETVEKSQIIFVEDMLERVYDSIDGAKEDIGVGFKKEIKNRIKSKQSEKEYFMCKNELWDVWLQKLFAQMISVKVWVIILITVLLVCSLISSVEFISVLGIVMGMKGVFNTASVWKDKTSNKVIDRV
jgi:hypothetical protein